MPATLSSSLTVITMGIQSLEMSHLRVDCQHIASEEETAASPSPDLKAGEDSPWHVPLFRNDPQSVKRSEVRNVIRPDARRSIDSDWIVRS